MSTPSKARNLDGEYTQSSPAANRQVGSKQFTLNSTTTSATLSSGVTALKRKKLLVRCESDDEVIVYLGNADVTTSDGFPMYPGDQQAFDVDEGATMKAVVSGLTGGDEAKVYILELE